MAWPVFEIERESVEGSDRSGYVVAYIGGSGRSGSTICDMMLGGSSRAFSVGQIDELNSWISAGRYCTCGRVIDECPFWEPIVEEAGQAIPPSLNVGGRVNKVLLALGIMLRPKSSDDEAVRRAWELFDRVARHSRKGVITDSSKAALRLARLSRSAEGHRLRVIHLVRDARGYVASRSFSTVVKGPDGTVGRTSPLGKRVAVADWLVQNALTFVLGVLFFRGRYLVVTYEELTTDTENVLRRLAGFLGVDYEPSMLPPFERENLHLIGGNSSRLAFSEVRYDDKWRQKLTPGEQWAVRVTTGWLYAGLAQLSMHQARVVPAPK
jgi:hypothetical protein